MVGPFSHDIIALDVLLAVAHSPAQQAAWVVNQDPSKLRLQLMMSITQ